MFKIYIHTGDILNPSDFLYIFTWPPKYDASEREERKAETGARTLSSHQAITVAAHGLSPCQPPTTPASASSHRTRLRCLPLKSRIGSNRTQAFNRATWLPQGLLKSSMTGSWAKRCVWREEWEWGNLYSEELCIIWEPINLQGAFCPLSSYFFFSTWIHTSGVCWPIMDFTVLSQTRKAFKKHI